jgi:hypothetical protein
MSNNASRDLATDYCNAILDRGIDFDADLWLIKQATAVLKACKEIGATRSDVMLLLIELVNGQSDMTGFVPWEQWAKPRGLSSKPSLNNLLYVHPQGRQDACLLQAALELPDPPPMFDLHGWSEWVARYGKRALAKGIWDGIFPYPPWRSPSECEMTPTRLTELVGEELTSLSVSRMVELESRLRNEQKLRFTN